ncbi:MAG: phospholipase D-like domain-containing protein [Methylobacter sp.]
MDGIFAERKMKQKQFYMLKRFSLLFFIFLTACASFPQHFYSYQSYSLSFNHPENTKLGRDFINVAKQHAGLSGFYILNNGVDGFIARNQLIARAQASLDLQYYIFRQDKTGMALTERLLRAADRGVKIRILVDDGNTMDGDEQLLSLAAHPNIQIRTFNPFYFRGHNDFVRLLEIKAGNAGLDYRMHNKLFIADNAVALIGGRNIGDEYFQVDPDSQLGDDDVFTVGPMVKKLSQSFDEFWNSTHAVPAQIIAPELTNTDALDHFKKQLAINLRNLEKQDESFIKRMNSSQILNRLFTDSPNLTWATAQLVYDSPYKKDVEDDSLAASLIYEPIKEAAESTRSELLIITPYLIPGDEGMKLFRILRDHEVSIRILTNSLESTPELLAHAGYSNYRKPLLKLGVKLYEIRAKLGKASGSGESKKLSRFGNYGLHAKQYVFDRRKVFLGSMNFDQRSMHLNTEIGLIIHSPELAKQALERFERLADASNSYEVLLMSESAGTSESLVWVTKQNGKFTEYTSEPSRNAIQLIKEDLMSIFPLDDEL